MIMRGHQPIAGAPAEPSPADERPLHEGLVGLLERYDVNDYAASVRVYAIKPANDRE